MTTNVCGSVCLSVCLCVEKNEIQSFYWMFVENSQVSSGRTRRKRRRSKRRKRSKKRMKRRLMSPISINKYHWTTFLDDR